MSSPSISAMSSPSTQGPVSDAQRKIQGQPAMEKLIPMINQLQDVFSTLGASSKVDLPQIVVVGSQSAGKSSVLESICHRDFLPRGSGIVTRRPLILQLNHVAPQPEGQPQEWGYFLHNKEKKFTDFDEICKEIEAETDRLAGDGQCVSDKPIGLRLYSPHVLNLTLVDLPGIARNPVGDQPKNIEVLIKEMVMKFITKENALILAVSAANQDLATSDAISMAQRADPNGDRTIGVLTKLDLMDRGTDAYNVLMNKECPLKLGWTGVVNRSQAAIDEKQPIQTARFEEMKFFLNHPKYRAIAEQQGTDYLCTKLNRILIRHIQKTLPGLRERINDLTVKYQQEMESYGATIDESARGATLLNIISHYSVAYCNTIEGRNYNLESKKLEGGSRINYIFTKVVRKMFDDVKIGDIANPEAIRTVIRNASGTQTALFFPEHAIDVFVNRILLTLEKPSQKIIDMVVQELVTVCKSVASTVPELSRFARISSEITELAEDLIRELSEPCHKFIKNIIECELSYVNTMHPDFLSNLDTNNINSGSTPAGNGATSPTLGSVINSALLNQPNGFGNNGGSNTKFTS